TIGYANGTLSVTPKALTIIANDGSHVYGSSTGFSGSEFTSAGLVNGDSVTSLTLTSAGTSSTASVGNYAITGSTAHGTGLSNYTIGYANGTLSVTPKALTIKVNDATHVYGGGTGFSGSEFTTSGLVNGDTVNALALASAGAATTAGVGTYAITGSAAHGNGLSNYTIGYAKGTLVVTPKELKITADDAAQVYGTGSSFSGSEFTATGLVNGDSVNSLTLASAGAAATAGVGAYAITGSAARGTGLSNYAIGYASGMLVVTPKALTITANDSTHVYGDGTALSGREFRTSDLVNGDAVVSLALASTGAAATTSVGTYAISGSAAQGSGLSNYAVTYVNGALTVSPRELLYVGDPVQVPFGGAVGSLTGRLQGLVNGDTLASAFNGSPHWSAAAGAMDIPGAHAITGSGLEPIGPNYTLVQAPSNGHALHVFTRVTTGVGSDLVQPEVPGIVGSLPLCGMDRRLNCMR
ncbi:MAG: MBG domain-containing protein, partial [Betaproteobacteria bacterium]